MKKLLLTLVLFVLTVNSASAKEKLTKGDAIDKICKNVGEYAQSVMTSRQLGENITRNIDILNNNTNMSETIKSYYKNIVYEAYRSHKWSTKENQVNEITEFSNKMYLVCAEAFQQELN